MVTARQSGDNAPLVHDGRLPLALEPLIEAFLEDVRARGLSPRTAEGYEARLRRVLLPFCERQGVTSIEQLDRQVMNRLSVELQTQGPGGAPLSRVSINSYLNTVNIWLNWCSKEGMPAPAKARLQKVARKLLDVLTREEVEELEALADSERDKLIVRVLADTGLRAGELLGLRARDLYQEGRFKHFIHVSGKDMRERRVPVTDPALFRRLEKHAKGLGPEERIFRTLRDRNGSRHPLTIDGLEGMLRSLRLKSGMKKRVYAHLFRHSFATWMLGLGVNPVQLARILGHSSLQMIDRVYSHLSADDAYEAMAKAIRAEET